MRQRQPFVDEHKIPLGPGEPLQRRFAVVGEADILGIGQKAGDVTGSPLGDSAGDGGRSFDARCALREKWQITERR